MKKSAGLTLIELVVVLLVIGILVATALPKFVDMGVDARIVNMESLGATLAAIKRARLARHLARKNPAQPDNTTAVSKALKDDSRVGRGETGRDKERLTEYGEAKRGHPAQPTTHG